MVLLLYLGAYGGKFSCLPVCSIYTSDKDSFKTIRAMENTNETPLVAMNLPCRSGREGGRKLE